MRPRATLHPVAPAVSNPGPGAHLVEHHRKGHTVRKIKYLSLAEITPAENNPKGHDLGLIVASIGRFGFTEAALLDGRTGRLVGGHGRLEALRAIEAYRAGGGGRIPEGLDDTAAELERAAARTRGAEGAAAAGYALDLEVWAAFDAGAGDVHGDEVGAPEGVQVTAAGVWGAPVLHGWSSRDDAEAAALLVALNRSSEVGGWDVQGLAGLLAELPDDLLDVAGYDPAELEALAAEALALSVELPPDEPPAVDAPAPAPAEAAAGPVRRTVRNTTTDRSETITERPAELRPEPRDTYRQTWGLLVTCLDEDDQGRALAELRNQGYRVEPVRSE